MNMPSENVPVAADAESLNRPLLVVTALLQGLLLLWLKNSIEHQFWPHDSGAVELAIWALVLYIPLLLLVILTRENQRRIVPAAAAFAVVLVVVGSYTGWQLEPDEFVVGNAILGVFFATLTLLGFKVAIYLQTWGEGVAFSYGRLFRYSWRNAILIGISGLFVLVFWAILALWGELFAAVGIDLFRDLFRDEWFLFPALALANGLAFVIFRRLIRIVDTVTQILRALCLFLLPLLVFVSLLFLATLPFVGLQALWDTGHGTALVLWLQALILFFFNATFQEEVHESPYPLWLQRFIGTGLVLLPAYTLIAAWGLWMRVDQHGLTVDRCWAAVVIAVLGTFATAYSINLLRFRDRALPRFGRINVWVGLAVMCLMVLVNTPLLDFRKLTVTSQLARLERGDVDLADFDVRYLATGLGRPGYLALEALRETADEGFRERIADLYRGPPFDNEPLSGEEAAARLEVYTESPDVPALLREAVLASMLENESVRRASLIGVDLDGDGQVEWVSLFQTWWDYSVAALWIEDDAGWTDRPITISDPSSRALGEALDSGNISVEQPRWNLLRIGETVLRIPE